MNSQPKLSVRCRKTQFDLGTEWLTDRKADVQMDWMTDRHIIWTNGHVDRWPNEWTDRLTNWQTDILSERERERER